MPKGKVSLARKTLNESRKVAIYCTKGKGIKNGNEKSKGEQKGRSLGNKSLKY